MNSALPPEALDSLHRTALVPFWARVRDQQSADSILEDRYAASIAKLVEARFGVLEVGLATQVGCCLRNWLVDEWLLELAGIYESIAIVDIGVGLDTRIQRHPRLARNYFEVDYQPIISLRDEWLADTGAVRLVGDGMDVDIWAHTFDHKAHSPVVIALVGVLPYQDEVRISQFFARAASLHPGAFVIFDSVSPYAAWTANRPAARPHQRPVYAWSVRSTRRIRAGTTCLRVLEEKGFMDLPSSLTRGFSRRDRLVHSVPPLRRAYRLTLAQLPK